MALLQESAVESPDLAPAVLLPETEAPAAEEFTDLLGQAVGIRLDSVWREFGGRDEMHVTALKDISLQIGPCEFVSIVGPSGCGKTTLLSLIGALDKPTSGHVYAAGLPVDQLSDGDAANYRLQRVSTIFQTFNLIPSMTAEANVALPLTLAGIELDERTKRARHLLKLVGLADRATTRVSRLSGGEQQKVAVARALANRPGLILADEPTGSLDTAAGEVILKLLEDLNRRGATVVLVTHDPQVARRAHRVIRMVDGRAIELERGNDTIRNQDPVTPPNRLHWRDTLKVGMRGTVRRPLRTLLTTAGVAIGIAAMTLIAALAGGLQGALSSPALARSQLHQVAVYPSGSAPVGFGSGTLTTLGRLQHVRAAWGEVAMTGTFLVEGSTASAVLPQGALVSLPPRITSPLLNTGWKNGEFANITLLADSGGAVDGLRNRVTALGFQAQSFGDLFRGFEDLLSRLRIALLALAVVALLLACLGIANTMYSAVLERTKEIGVLKALGARSHDVLLLFVAEAAVIGLAGGIIGTLGAVALAQAGNAAVDRLAQSVAGAGIEVFRTDALIAVVALLVAVIISTGSGLLPAVRAARQDPSRALRYE